MVSGSRLIFHFVVLTLLMLGCDAASITTPGDDDEDPGSVSALIAGGSDEDFGTSVIQTSDGGFLVVGSFSSVDGDFGGRSIGSQDLFAMKLNAAGNIDWLRSYGGNNIDGATDVIEDSAGNFVIAGFSQSNTGNFTGLNRGNLDAALIKITPDGTFLWARSFGGSSNELATAVVEGPNGGYVLTGNTRSVDGNFSNRSNTSSDIFLILTDFNGQPAWFRTYGGTADDEGLDLTITAQNRIAVTGFFESSNGTFSNLQLGGASFFVLETELNGSLSGLTTYGGSGNDIANSIIATADGGFAVAGASNSNSFHFDGLNRGDYDAFIMKLNAGRSIEWVNSFGGSGFDQAFTVIQTLEGDYRIAGESNSNDGNLENLNRGNLDLFLISVSSDGDVMFTRSIGGSDDDSAQSLIELTNGNFALTGYTRSTDGDFSVRSAANEDVIFITGDPEPDSGPEE